MLRYKSFLFSDQIIAKCVRVSPLIFIYFKFAQMSTFVFY